MEWAEHVKELDDKAKEIKERMGMETLCQPFRKLEHMYPRVVITQNKLRLVLERVRIQLNLECERVKCGKHKRMYRALQKMAFHRHRQWDCDIWDLARGLLCLDDLGGIVQAFIEICAVTDYNMEVVALDNKFSVQPKKMWQDAKVYVRFLDEDEPIIAEIQLCLQSFYTIRKDLKGHETYSNYRCAEELLAFCKHTMKNN